MKNELIPFNFKNNPIRVRVIDETPLFCVSDLRKALDIPQDSSLIQRLRGRFVKNKLIDGLGRKRDGYFCYQKDAYIIILKSNSPLAEPMVEWVCGEVLPAIAKDGYYINDRIVDVKPHQRKLPSGRTSKEVVVARLEEQAKKEIGGIVKNCAAVVVKDAMQGITVTKSDLPVFDLPDWMNRAEVTPKEVMDTLLHLLPKMRAFLGFEENWQNEGMRRLYALLRAVYATNVNFFTVARETAFSCRMMTGNERYTKDEACKRMEALNTAAYVLPVTIR